ncbi:hypothetical protein SUGI_0175090 [Cryptomeria japonica]|nr:hypothetical protein SUGI_0175090 [Cryptomeria japonica]
MSYDDPFASVGGSALNSFDDLQKVAEGTTSIRTKENRNGNVVEVVHSAHAVLGDVNACNVILDSTFNARLRDFSLVRWLEHAGVGFGSFNGPLAEEICLTDSVTATEWKSVVEELLHVTSHLRYPEWSQRVTAVEEAIEVLSVIRLFFLFCDAFLEREVRRCADNGLNVLATSHPYSANFLPLFEIVVSTVSEVSTGVGLPEYQNGLDRNIDYVYRQGLDIDYRKRLADRDLGKLGPKTKDAEFGLPVEAKRNDGGSNVLQECVVTVAEPKGW